MRGLRAILLDALSEVRSATPRALRVRHDVASRRRLPVCLARWRCCGDRDAALAKGFPAAVRRVWHRPVSRTWRRRTTAVRCGGWKYLITVRVPEIRSLAAVAALAVKSAARESTCGIARTTRTALHSPGAARAATPTATSRRLGLREAIADRDRATAREQRRVEAIATGSLEARGSRSRCRCVS